MKDHKDNYGVQDFPFSSLKEIPPIKNRAGNPWRKKRVAYKDIVTAYDIETTGLKEIKQSIMYIWQWHFDGIGTVFGRTWQEFMDFCRRVKDNLEGQTLVAYVHVLSHEFQFLKGVYQFKSDEIFATDKREILKITILDCIEMRCSYRLTNLSLDAFLDQMDVEVKKQTLDYSIYRFPWDELDEHTIEYSKADVVGLVQGIKKLMAMENDTLATIPLTSTGFVRRDTKRAMHKTRHGMAASILPEYYLYKEALEAFRGGDTHANRYCVGKILTDLSSYDRVSSYPSVLLNCKYPMRPFVMVKEVMGRKRIEKLIYEREKPLLFRAAFEKLKLKDEFWATPYIPLDKTRNIKNFINDNGRILCADYLEITITDIDYKVINREYDFDMMAFDVSYSGYQRLPKQWTDTILMYYDRKTALKGIVDKEQEYMLSKTKINAEYGMSAQRPVKQKLILNQDNLLEFTDFVEEDLFYESQKNCFLSYAWGVWTTAYARYYLHEMLWTIDEQNALHVYGDTDCCKYQGNVDWTAYNQKRIKADLERGGYATDKNGITHYLGTVEQEKHIRRFKTFGAKKYAWEDDEGKLYITIAGVDKKKGAKELRELGGLEAFREGIVFREGGGTESVYNDTAYGWYEIDGHKIYITPNLYIKDSEYTLGLSTDYLTLLKNILHGGII